MNFEVGAGTELADPSRDVRAFRFAVFRGTDRVAVYNAAISGTDLVYSGLDGMSTESLMWAMARASIPHLAPLLATQRVPRRDDSVFEIRARLTSRMPSE